MQPIGSFVYTSTTPTPPHAYSPIKHGEYWACGLPVIIPENSGDDSDILKKTNLGVVVSGNLLTKESINKLTDIARTGKERRIRELANKFRNSTAITTAYVDLILQ